MLFTVTYAPSFVRAVKKFPLALQIEVAEKIELFTDATNHERLKTHALHGRMKGLHSFSVNYRTRVVVRIRRDTCDVYMLDVGDRSIYE
jgi:mRNA-degrading endonuclease YafQ of YafQ-DinJ toxin-antitoxin module